MLLMIDNYDSFTYNLVQYFGELGQQVRVVRNDEIDVAGIVELKPERLVLSPGPCTPAEAGVCVPAIQALAGRLPILGVCLGHQSIGAALGGRIVRAQRLMHGKASTVTTDGRGLFVGPARRIQRDPLSLAGDRARQLSARTSWSRPLRKTARSWVYATASLALEGVQFHPESILSEHGHAMLRNFLSMEVH